VIFTGADIAQATGGELRGDGNDSVSSVTTDSRQIAPGALFVALKGERFDGHDFVPAVVAAGCRVVLVERGWADVHPVPPGCTAILVDDTLRAFGDLAAAHRGRYKMPVVAVTGSNGKTTVKEMLAAILAQTGPGLKTEGNLNNLIGLPQMLFRLTTEHRWAVLEMGMSELGEIDRLAALAAPRRGIITNVNAAHLASMQNIEQVALAKGELFRRLPVDGWAIYNADDALVAGCPTAPGVRRLGFGIEQGEVTARELVSLGALGQRFKLVLPSATVTVQLPVPGKHNLLDALAAAAGAWTLGISAEAIAAGLGGFVPYRQRFNLVDCNGVTIVDDTYNANPASMAAALATLADCAAGNRRLVVLGEMRELGSDEVRLHRAVGAQAAATADRLLVMGELGREIATGALAAGMPAAAVTAVTTHEEAVAQLAADVISGDWVLVKGSRGMSMERVVNGLRARLAESAGKGA
jgi:UDP-N-acetylmuramoyl-tripeptide--D-alanyl-D-alanine ligase